MGGKSLARSVYRAAGRLLVAIGATELGQIARRPAVHHRRRGAAFPRSLYRMVGIDAPAPRFGDNAERKADSFNTNNSARLLRMSARPRPRQTLVGGKVG